MIHQRNVIREAAVAALISANTAAGSRVHDHPSDPRTAFPALSVFDGGELQRATTMPGGANRTIERLFSLEISAEVVQVSNYARARSELLAEVEAALAVLSIPGVKSIVPAGYSPDQTFDGERPIAVGRQRFDISYFTPQGNPAASL